jgi:hypothetical protein
MRTLMWVVMVVLICGVVYDFWGVREVRMDLQETKDALASGGRIQQDSKELAKAMGLVDRARAHLGKAQEALKQGRPEDSKLYIKLALEKLEEAEKVTENQPGAQKGVLAEIKDAVGKIKDTLGSKPPEPGKRGGGK